MNKRIKKKIRNRLLCRTYKGFEEMKKFIDMSTMQLTCFSAKHLLCEYSNQMPFKPYLYNKYNISNEFVKYRKGTDDIEDPVVISESLAKQYADNVTPITSRIDGDVIANATYGSDIITGFGNETGNDDRVNIIKALHEAGKATIERIEKGETTKEDDDMIDFLHDLFNV